MLSVTTGILSGCSSINKAMGGNTPKEALAQASWNYAQSGLRLQITADANLNPYEGEAHSVVVAVMQFAEAEVFYQLQGNPGGLETLLQGGKPPAGILQLDRLAVEPGTQSGVWLDRTQGARYVGVFTGYFAAALPASGRLFAFPVAVQTSGLVVKDYSAQVSAAELQLALGRDRVLNAELVALPPREPASGEQPASEPGGLVRLGY